MFDYGRSRTVFRREYFPAVKNPAYFFILFSIVRRWLMCDSSMLS